MGMGKFNSDDHYVYYCGQESLRRNGVAIMVNKRVWNAVLGCNLKNNRKISVHFQGKPFNITAIQVYAPTTDAQEAEVDLFQKDLLEQTPKRDVLFIIGDWNAKEGSQEIPGVTGKVGLGVPKWSRAKASRVLPREHTDHSKDPLPAMQENTLHMDITTKIRLIIFFAAKDGEALYSQQKQDWELTLAQIMNSLLQNLDLNWKK